MPLSGIRVVDLTRILAGPFCTMILADMGAEMVKIETPGTRDPLRDAGRDARRSVLVFRRIQPQQALAVAQFAQRGRQGGLARLIAGSDVLVENYRPGVLEAMGFGEARLRATQARPGLRQYQRLRHDRAVSRSALLRFYRAGDERLYGRDRPGRWRADARRTAARRSGRRALWRDRGLRGAGPARPHRPGDTVGASLNNGLISLLAYLAANHLATGEEPRRTGNDHPIVSPYGMFRTADGEVALAPSQEQSYQRLVDALAMPDLRQDPRFLTNDLRVANRAAMNEAVEARLGADTTEYWIDI